jgi:hypothetical protein
MTLKDAARFQAESGGCLSNGPDNASMVAPEDVRELARSGIPIYMISTQEARLDPVSTAVFDAWPRLPAAKFIC